MSDLPTAGDIAQYDQALSECEELLANMTTAYLRQRKDHAELGYPECVTVVTLTQWLTDDIPHDVTASALAVAILAIARNTVVDAG